MPRRWSKIWSKQLSDADSLTVVFYHAGDQAQHCDLMVASLKRVAPECRIIQCSDSVSPVVSGVTDVFRLNQPSKSQFMLERVQSFANLGLRSPAVYVDTDLLWLRTFSPGMALGKQDAIFCRRSFNLNTPFNSTFADRVFSNQHQRVIDKTIDFHEHSGRTLGNVFPYLACFTITGSYQTWELVLQNLRNLHPKYLEWYGDQEAIRNLTEAKSIRFSLIDEKVCACLPEHLKDCTEPPLTVHFKGGKRKPAMLSAARHLKLI